MILVILLLFVFGVFAILAEAVLPFGIAMTFGFIAILGSGYLAYNDGGPVLGTVYMIVSVILAVSIARFTLKYGLSWLRLRPPKRTDAGSAWRSDRDTPRRSPEPGDLAEVVQPLRPTGTIEWEERRFAARTLQPEHELAIGSKVKIVDRDSTFYLVELIPSGDSFTEGASAESS
jgi:membrane-bound ClpP family serine protease